MAVVTWLTGKIFVRDRSELPYTRYDLEPESGYRIPPPGNPHTDPSRSHPHRNPSRSHPHTDPSRSHPHTDPSLIEAYHIHTLERHERRRLGHLIQLQ